MSEQSGPSASQPFVRLVTMSTLTKLADVLISAKTTLPWLLGHLGAPAWMTALLVPIRESGALIPQYIIKQRTADCRERVRLWQTGILIEGMAVLSMALIAMTLTGPMAGAAILVALGVLSVARALCSLTSKDMQGVLVEKGRRGRLVGMASSLSGILSLLGAGLLLFGEQVIAQGVITALLFVAAMGYLAALLPSWGLSAELKDSQGEGTASLWHSIQSHPSLRHLIINRCLLMHGALIAPYFVMQAQGQSGSLSLAYFIIASACATFLSSYVWGQLSDRSAVLTLRIAGIACAAVALVFYLDVAGSGVWVSVLLFFLLSLSYAGVRTGRKTYLLDIAEGTKRTEFVATANTCVGYVLLALGGLYALLHSVLGQHLTALMAGLMLLGVVHSRWLQREK